ncbi:MAG: hypothetical protein WD377_01705, partial [Nitriliruptoraceae bacterium]
SVLALAILIIAAERLLRGRARFEQRGRGEGIAPIVLRGRRGQLATATCIAVLGLAVVTPVVQLVVWTVAGGGLAETAGRIASHLTNSVILAVIAAVVCAAGGLVLVNALRLSQDRLTPRLVRVANIGYALPGPVIAIGTLLLLAGVDRALAAAGLDMGGGG